MTDEQVLIQFIRNHANAHYDKGWSVIVESWLDGDILEVLSECQFDLIKALSELQGYVDAYLQKEEDISY
jgi:hypothetical protein